jgi:leucyl aminopeptidase
MAASVPSDSLLRHAPTSALPLWLISEGALDGWLSEQPAAVVQWLGAVAFKAERHRVALLPSPTGGVTAAVLGLGKLVDLQELSLWHTAGLADKLPPLDFRCATPLPAAAATQAALGFVYGQYRFDRYRRPLAHARSARLIAPDGCDVAQVTRAATALGWARDLINTPAADLAPADLAREARAMAERLGARCTVIAGEELLRQNYPAIHSVGRASSNPPHLIDLCWGEEGAPKVTLVGKGVCFDSGGLDLKTSQSMALMKKDMGGAACALALAQMIMDARLPVRLRVLVPAVENSVGGNAYRPGDVLATRKGLTVEVGNTDAEGRLVLCDALTEADAERPDLLIDMATLTGAARVALGPELPAVYGSEEALVNELMHHARIEHDPMWPMPLWAPYDDDLSSKLADLNNVSASAFAGSIIGGLFLRRFVGEDTRWMHIDLFAWNPKERPGRPVGAEAQCVRALFAMMQARYPA